MGRGGLHPEYWDELARVLHPSPAKWLGNRWQKRKKMLPKYWTNWLGCCTHAPRSGSGVAPSGQALQSGWVTRWQKRKKSYQSIWLGCCGGRATLFRARTKAFGAPIFQHMPMPWWLYPMLGSVSSKVYQAINQPTNQSINH